MNLAEGRTSRVGSTAAWVDHARAPRASWQRARKLRLARGLTQEKLAADAEVDRTFLNRLERGQFARGPTLVTILQLARGLRVSPRRLF